MNMIDASHANVSSNDKPTKRDSALNARSLRSWETHRHLIALTFALLGALLLSGCQTAGRSIGSTAAAGNKCGPFKEIDYDGRRDTPRTVRNVRVHNQSGADYGCWRKP